MIAEFLKMQIDRSCIDSSSLVRQHCFSFRLRQGMIVQAPFMMTLLSLRSMIIIADDDKIDRVQSQALTDVR